jgi:predicted nucleic acid-binding Zn ribbon protein
MPEDRPEDRPEDTAGSDGKRRVPRRREAPDSGDPGDSGDSDGGPARPGDEDFPEQDAPQALLNRLRSASEARGTPRGPAPKQQGKTSRRRYSPEPVYGGRDPEGVGNVFSRMLAERGWKSPVAIGSVLTRWDEIVGADIAAHCVPESFDADTVLVRCDSTAWATQLRLITPQVLQRFEAELGAGVVKRLSVVGPAAPSWRKGGRTVKGRGPRDTYG